MEIQGAGREPVPDYTLQDWQDVYGDEIEHAVGWKGEDDLGHIAGQPVRLRFVMKDTGCVAKNCGQAHEDGKRWGERNARRLIQTHGSTTVNRGRTKTAQDSTICWIVTRNKLLYLVSGIST